VWPLRSAGCLWVRRLQVTKESCPVNVVVFVRRFTLGIGAFIGKTFFCSFSIRKVSLEKIIALNYQLNQLKEQFK
jgi:hypothetical protein